LIEHNFDIKKYYDTDEQLKNIFLKICEDVSKRYDLEDYIGHGGSAIVIRVSEKNKSKSFALKVSHLKQPGNKNTVENEIRTLSNLRNDNIISLYYSNQINVYNSHVFYYVMDLSEENKNLYNYITDLIKTTKLIDSKKVTDEENITVDLDNLSELKESNNNTNDKRRNFLTIIDETFVFFSQIADAISYMHNEGNYVHLDVKPSNILIIRNKAVLSDFGSAINLDEKDGSVIEIGPFTREYCHKELLEEMEGVTNGRVKRMKKNNITQKFDNYAFGKSILEILKLIYDNYSEFVSDSYLFSYLHLSACRMLDGENSHSKRKADGSIILDNKFFTEEWNGMDNTEFGPIKYITSKAISEDFKKAKIKIPYPEKIPELDLFYKKRITDDYEIIIPFSERVKKIVENPYFRRLESVTQLGLVNTIFPSVTHNRFEHSIGVFGVTCSYIMQLYNDPYNPLFKQMVNEKDIKNLMLASLLHDIGHYPLSHEICEALQTNETERIRHERLSAEIIEKSHSLREILLLPDKDGGWGLEKGDLDTISLLIKLSNNPNHNKADFKTRMLSSILNGFIDSDKLDYYRRDSLNAYLKYGAGIDVERLISNLTIDMKRNDVRQSIDFVLSVYEKGETAVESFVFTRYLLYKTMYWHHTARSVRSMLSVILTEITNNKLKLESFVKEIEELQVSKSDNITIKNIFDIIRKYLELKGKKTQQTDNSSHCIEMLDMIEKRNYYKRLLTLHQEEDVSLISNLQQNRSSKSLLHITSKLQKTILEDIRKRDNSKQDDGISRTIYETESFLEKVLNEEQNLFIIDIPDPPWATEGRQEEHFRIVPEPLRISREYLRIELNRGRDAEVFETYKGLMNTLTRVRLFVHPKIRDSIQYRYTNEQIKQFLAEVSKIIYSF
jgi:HD superfamily phosphohydrolase